MHVSIVDSYSTADITHLIRATMKPIMNGERKGDMMNPIVQMFNW